MTIDDLLKQQPLTTISQGDTSREISQVFCCDLLLKCGHYAPP